jgi:hypothetical protein
MPPPTGRHQRATPPSFAQHCFKKLRLHHKLLSTFVTHRMSALLTASRSRLRPAAGRAPTSRSDLPRENRERVGETVGAGSGQATRASRARARS